MNFSFFLSLRQLLPNIKAVAGWLIAILETVLILVDKLTAVPVPTAPASRSTVHDVQDVEFEDVHDYTTSTKGDAYPAAHGVNDSPY